MTDSFKAMLGKIESQAKADAESYVPETPLISPRILDVTFMAFMLARIIAKKAHASEDETFIRLAETLVNCNDIIGEYLAAFIKTQEALAQMEAEQTVAAHNGGCDHV